nr:noncompact myelin-associated protein isoform X3 [Pogona vitticeps]
MAFLDLRWQSLPASTASGLKLQEEALWMMLGVLVKGSGAIIAAIVVGVIIIFTVVLLLLKMYNRRMRAKRELEPKNAKTTVPSILGQSPNSPNAQGRHTTVTFVPVDVHVPNRRP